ncbi:STAS domain-containing protein [Amycolatopsis nalaikhensis]|uniref:STAS domain-containing protein n=1 Tax=Amycolatopsis nalaikhensis TaxID=715472 RepID=A0ABY8XU22_9PSEU|nr:STAS domain-containing protein [Amycolatopsis sp. 2-2]WIV59153.1 STAS domain-containing protein [Amycolatopsis sp. 2-2]
MCAGEAATLTALIIDTVAMELPTTLLIDLRHVTALDFAGLRALLAGYRAAVDHGTSYHLLHAEGPARDLLQATGTLDMLADSDDLGALMLAVLTQPSTDRSA